MCVLVVSSGVTDVSVSPSSVVVLGNAFLSDSDCEIVKPQFSSFSSKRRAFQMESREYVDVATSAEDA